MIDPSAPIEEETVSQHPESPSPVHDDELMCRGAFTMHVKKSGKIQQSVIDKTDLLNGTCSVWRQSKQAGTTDGDIENIIESNKPANQELLNILKSRARSIRKLRTESSPRLFMILDNCVCNSDGDTHAAHAEIGILQSLRVNFENDDAKLLTARALLYDCFRFGRQN